VATVEVFVVEATVVVVVVAAGGVVVVVLSAGAGAGAGGVVVGVVDGVVSVGATAFGTALPSSGGAGASGLFSTMTRVPAPTWS
jgi:hypothetical protein